MLCAGDAMELRANLRKVLDRICNDFHQTKTQTQLYTHHNGTLQSPWETISDVEGCFTYNVDEKTGSVTWEITKNTSDQINLCTPVFQITSKNHCKTRQKIVAEYFTSKINSDTSWSAIDSNIKDKPRPEMIHQLGHKTWLVLGLGTTTALGSNDSLQNAYKSIFLELRPTIKQIIQRDPEIKIYFWIVIVGPTEVYTTFRLDGDAIDELVFRFRVGIAMEDVLSELGLYTANDNVLTEKERVASGSIASLATAVMNGHDKSLNEHSVMNFQNFEPDKEYIKDSMKLMMEETKKLSKSKQESIDEMNQAFEKVEHEIARMGINVRMDSKAVVQMPFVMAQVSSEENLFSAVHFLPSDTLPNVVDHIWREAYKSRLANPERFEQLSLDEEIKIAVSVGFSEAPDSKNNNSHKVDVELSVEQEMVLALDGLHGKKYVNYAFKTQRKSHQQKSFSLNCDTTDIENCLKIKPKPCDIPNFYMEKLEPLLNKATNLAVNTTNGLIVLRDLMSTDVALALCQMSAIAQELAASLEKQVSCEKWIFKKVLYYDIELLIKPTRPKSHIFFLLRFKGNPLEKGAFRNVHYHDSWWYTDLLSINESRLNNFIRAPALYLNTLVHFRVNVSRMEPEDLGQISSDGYSETIAMLTLLIALEDKSQTEEMALNVRYLIMQFAKGEDSLSMPRPGPAVLKTPALLRSRLTVHLYKQIKMYCLKQWKTLPEKIDTKMELVDHSPDFFKNLLCPYTHTELSTFYDAVQVMYIAYAKNKNAIPEQNCDYGMIKKIAEHCLNVDPAKTNKYNGLEDPDPGLPGPHEFSPSFLSEACTLLKQKFRAQLGRNWMQSAETRILRELIQATHHEALATMKASAVVSKSNKVKSEQGTASCKCHEAVIRELELDLATHPSLIGDYTSIFKEVTNELGGVSCNLFKKQQHGGLREIYVLTFKSRLLQLLPEVAARVLCSMCPEEVLTHPDKKMSGYETHHTNVISALEKGLSTDVLHRTSSEDKSKWSQGMNVNAFAFMFAQLLPSAIANAIARVMHSFRNKKVVVPKSVVKIFKQQLKLKADTYNELKDDFWKGSESKHFIFGPEDNVCMKTPTGMWQGILHYSSSLLHVLQTVHYKNACKLHFNDVCDKMISNSINQTTQDQKTLGTLILDTLVGSDDSATYGSIILPQGYSPEMALKAEQVLDFLLKLEVFHSRFFMMTESSKSIISSRTVAEFNSVFVCSKTYINPVVKKVLSATTIPVKEDLQSIQMEMSNMLKDMLEEGACHYQIHLVELVNSFLHYTAFGLCTCRLFSSWTDMLVTYPDPHLGFMLLDLQEIAGNFGFEFKKYNSLVDTNVSVIPSHPTILRSESKKSFSLGVTLTDRKKWLKFKDRVVSPGWEKYLEKNPHVLYLERGQTREEIKARLSVKACSRGILETFHENKSMARLILKSYNLLARRLVSVKQLDLIEDGTSEDLISSTTLESLLQLTLKYIKGVENDTQLVHCNLTPKQISVIYPNNISHKIVSQTVRAARERKLFKTIRYAKFECKLDLTSASGTTNDIVLPLMTLVRWKWLSYTTTYAQTVLEYFWNRYTGIFPWLRETLEETLVESPFKSHIRLYDFIYGLDEKGSELNLLYRRLKIFSAFDQILELSSHNQYPQLMGREDEHQQCTPQL